MNIWTGEFGDQYTRRSVDWDASFLPFLWDRFVPKDCRSVLEIGANTGRNLKAIAQKRNIELYASEPNELALGSLLEWLPKENVRADFADQLGFPDGVADLALTAGVLIHVPTDKLIASLRQIYRCARKWIICAEYHSKVERMIPYRGTTDTLWTRPYGRLWRENFPDLQLELGPLLCEEHETGLDDVTIWLFEKGKPKH